MTEDSTIVFARGKAPPGSPVGLFCDPHNDGVQITVSDGDDAFQIVLKPDEAAALAESLSQQSRLHYTPATSN